MKIKKLSGGKWNNGDLAQLPCPMRREQVAVQPTMATPADEAFGAVLSAISGALGGGEDGEGAVGLRRTKTGGCETHAVWSERETGRLLFSDPGLVTHAYVTRDLCRAFKKWTGAPPSAFGSSGNSAATPDSFRLVPPRAATGLASRRQARLARSGKPVAAPARPRACDDDLWYPHGSGC